MVDDDRDHEEDAMSLVRLAGPRPSPSTQQAAAARAHVHAAWRAGIRRRRNRTALLVAAAVVVAAGLALLLERETRREPQVAQVPAGSAVVARLEVAAGAVDREGASGWVPLRVGESLAAGSLIRTGTEGAGFSVERGRSVRMGPQSRLRWVAMDRLALEAGAVYVDSGGPAAGPSPFEVHTVWGALRENGTQFEIRLEPAALRVRVREGRVALFGRGPTLDVASGIELRVNGAGIGRRTIPSHGPEWSWAIALAPAFEMEGRALHALLVRTSREAGWELHYTDGETRRRSEAAQLHGSIRGLSPEETVRAVLPSTDLPYRLHDGVLSVGPVHGSPER